jgi:hypothetical protein
MDTQFCANKIAQQLATSAWASAINADLQQLHAHWLACSAGKPMPGLADFDLGELVIGYPGILLARAMPESSAHDFLFHPLAQFVTAGEKGAPGLEPTLFQHIPLEGCHLALNRRTPVADRVSELSSNGMPVDYDVIYLPLAADGGRVEAILILAVETLPGDCVA